MIIQLQPDQIASIWDGIKYSIATANKIPDNLAQGYLNNILTRFLSGNAQCWISYELENGNKNIIAITTTAIIDDSINGIKLFEIRTIYGFRPCPDSIYEEGFAALRKFAKAKGCKGIVVETYSNKIKAILSRQGFEERSTIFQSSL
jgi:hypothetical protein